MVPVTDRLPEVLLAGSPEIAAAAVRRDGRARSWRSRPHVADTWCETLAALLEHDGSAKHAAEALYCHRNTVIYRTKQIEELTGRRLSDPRDKLLLGLGLMSIAPDQSDESSQE